MNTVLKFVAGAPALIFVSIGLGWWVAPGFVSAQLGMPVLTEVGLSTQIGDLGSFFLTLGACILMGLATSQRVWLMPAIMLLAFAIGGRFIAWLFHDAALPLAMIGVEVSVVVVLLLTFRTMAKHQT